MEARYATENDIPFLLRAREANASGATSLSEQEFVEDLLASRLTFYLVGEIGQAVTGVAVLWGKGCAVYCYLLHEGPASTLLTNARAIHRMALEDMRKSGATEIVATVEFSHPQHDKLVKFHEAMAGLEPHALLMTAKV